MNNSTFSEFKFGKNLRFLRKHNRITLVELSESINIGKSTLSDYENNKTLASVDAIIKVSLYFNISIDILLNSDISELYSNKKNLNFAKPRSFPENENDLANFENEKYSFSVKLLHQKLESIDLQNKMLHHLLESKEAENKTLKINIKLLEEKLKGSKK